MQAESIKFKKNHTQSAEFVHLHNHTHYSLLDGLQKIQPLLDQVEAYGQKAVAITDHGTLSGVIEFYKEAKSRGIKPIIGIETYVAPRSHTDKESSADRNPYHLILLAKDNTGYKNLMKLSTIASLEGFYYKPRIDRDLLEKYSSGLICLSGCASGEVGSKILNGEDKAAEEAAIWHLKTFGQDNYYLEIQPHKDWEPQQKINQQVIKLSKKLGIGLVATGDAHYTAKEDHKPHEILLCVQTGTTLEDPNRMKMDMDLSFRETDYFIEAFANTPEAVSNTVKIADMCDLDIELGGILIPQFDVPQDETEQNYLRRLVYQGAAWRYGGVAKEDISIYSESKTKPKLDKSIIDRIEYELGVIDKMGYAGYFLIVADMINWAKNQGIVCGPGRGSAAGSIVAYTTNITDLDPIKYDLLFERFLNPERISMPDIDMDYADDRREEVIEYVTQKYGQDRVAQIITFGIMAARNAVRDTGRVLGYPYGEVDQLAKLIPPPIQGRHILLKDSVGLGDKSKIAPELAREYKINARAKKLIDIAILLEGTIRNAGTHAAGVVISKDPIVEYTPLTRASKGGVATAYSMNPIEDIGLLKFDFLGLSNLTIIKNTLRIIKRVYKKEIDIAQIPLDDKKTFEIFSSGDTTGVFQLESAGMKRYLRALKPDRFDDIIAMGALYRPGPLTAGLTDDYIERKNGRKKISYDHPTMQAALENTYGVLVYQEQVMQISKDMCGFSGGQADTLRKAIGKKKRDVMAKMKKDFINGAITHSQVSAEFAEKFWKKLEGFADYSFNKSHSACYALISVWTAYLKAHFPSAFMAALMTSDYGDLDRIAIEVTECRKMGIDLLPPDINESYLEFAVVPDTGNIRFGLSAIKNVGKGPIEAILAAREDSPFSSIEDFASRVDPSIVLNHKTFESLIKSGCFDSIADRDELLANIDKISSYAARVQKKALSAQIDIFGSLGTSLEQPPLKLDETSTITDIPTRLTWEKELLGLYLSKHPLDEYDNYLLTQTDNIKKFSAKLDGHETKVGGLINSVRKVVTKKGANMAFVQLETKHGNIEVIVFPQVFERSEDIIQTDKIIEINGKVNARDRNGALSDEVKIIADRIAEIDDNKLQETKISKTAAAEAASDQDIEIVIDSVADAKFLIALKHLLEKSNGNSNVFLRIGENGKKKIHLPYRVELSQQLLSGLHGLVNPKAIHYIAKKVAHKQS